MCGFLLLSASLYAQYNSDNLYLSSEKTRQAITFKNLQLFPVYANDAFEQAHDGVGNYVGLKDALADEMVVITEKETQNNIAQADSDLWRSLATQMLEENTLSLSDLRRLLGIEEPSQQSRENNPQQGESYNRPEDQQGESGEEEQTEAQETVEAIFNIFDDALLNSELLERFSSGNVNEIYITNTSNDTIYLMAGEVIKGGKQDRVLAHDMIVPPHSGQMEVSVFCVEKGRWAYHSPLDDQFDEYYNMCSMNLRHVVQTKGRQEDVLE